MTSTEFFQIKKRMFPRLSRFCLNPVQDVLFTTTLKLQKDVKTTLFKACKKNLDNNFQKANN